MDEISDDIQKKIGLNTHNEDNLIRRMDTMQFAAIAHRVADDDDESLIRRAAILCKWLELRGYNRTDIELMMKLINPEVFAALISVLHDRNPDVLRDYMTPIDDFYAIITMDDTKYQNLMETIGAHIVPEFRDKMYALRKFHPLADNDKYNVGLLLQLMAEQESTFKSSKGVRKFIDEVQARLSGKAITSFPDDPKDFISTVVCLIDDENDTEESRDEWRAELLRLPFYEMVSVALKICQDGEPEFLLKTAHDILRAVKRDTPARKDEDQKSPSATDLIHVRSRGEDDGEFY